MTPSQTRSALQARGLHKMSFGRSAKYWPEAHEGGVLLLGSDAPFYEAVLQGDDAGISRAARRIKSSDYPAGNPPAAAFGIWRRTIELFYSLPPGSPILHWDSDKDRLYWGFVEGPPQEIRHERDEFDQDQVVLRRTLVDGWHSESVGGVPLSNLHPKVRDLVVNRATLNAIQTDPDYLRALILDQDTSSWESRSDWQEKARETGWRPKDRAAILASRRATRMTAMVLEAAAYWQDEINRMAATAVHTASYARGQTVMTTIKAKDIGFTLAEIQEEIASLLKQQAGRCALTAYVFRVSEPNVHLKPSLDRKDSSIGYVPGNLQVVTRAANFFKSASDEEDWNSKAAAMERMAFAMQQARKEITARAHTHTS